MLNCFSRVRLFETPWTVACQASLSMGFSRKNAGVGCHVLLQRIFPTQELNPRLFCLMHWQAGSLPLAPSWKSIIMHVCVLVTQSCLTLWDSMDCSPPGSSIHGILQARILEWLAIPSSRGSSPPGIEPGPLALQVDSLPSEPQGMP